MLSLRFTTLALALFALPVLGQTLTGLELLERSIAHHDPRGEWRKFSKTLVFEESRPDGSVRESRVTIDLPGELFEQSATTEENAIVRRVEKGECTSTLDGSSEFSSELAEKHRLTCDQVKRYRDYYSFLWGLPMKLRDPGTRLSPEVTETTFQNRDVLSFQVTYDPAVGGDVWYFYFDPSSYALVGYKFHHDESKNDGEYIVLEGEYELGMMRFPQARTWYVNEDDKLLGTDKLVAHE